MNERRVLHFSQTERTISVQIHVLVHRWWRWRSRRSRLRSRRQFAAKTYWTNGRLGRHRLVWLLVSLLWRLLLLSLRLQRTKLLLRLWNKLLLLWNFRWNRCNLLLLLRLGNKILLRLVELFKQGWRLFLINRCRRQRHARLRRLSERDGLWLLWNLLLWLL